jgi:hypothetical protein
MRERPLAGSVERRRLALARVPDDLREVAQIGVRQRPEPLGRGGSKLVLELAQTVAGHRSTALLDIPTQMLAVD